MIQLSPVVKILLIINVVVFFIQNIIQGFNDIFVLRPITADDFQPFQLVSHFFMHGGLMHFFFNMFALVMFGAPVETRLGAKKFLIFYLFCAFGAAAINLGWNYWEVFKLQEVAQAFAIDPNFAQFTKFSDLINWKVINPDFKEAWVSMGEGVDVKDPQSIASVSETMNAYLKIVKNGAGMLGASGAIYGVLIAFGMLYPETSLYLMFIPVPIKAKYFIPIMLVAEFYLGTSGAFNTGIAHMAHLGGALFGVLLLLFWRRSL